MATAASAAARGPMAVLLGNTSAQWMVLGAGVYMLAPDHVRESVHRTLLAANAAANASSAVVHHAQPQQQHGPIVLRYEGNPNSNSNRSMMGTVVSIAVVAGSVTVGYVVITNLVPEHLQRFLPVTKKALDSATEKLAGSLLKIKNVLGNEIKKLQQQQDDLSDLQRETRQGVQDLNDRVELVGNDITSMHATVDRCELSLEQSQAMQAYTSRGVKLLVTAVTALSQPSEQIHKELQNYLRAGDLMFPQSSSRRQQQVRVGAPEDDRPQLTRSTSNSTSRRRLSPSMEEEHEKQQQQLKDIRNGLGVTLSPAH